MENTNSWIPFRAAEYADWWIYRSTTDYHDGTTDNYVSTPTSDFSKCGRDFSDWDVNVCYLDTAIPSEVIELKSRGKNIHPYTYPDFAVELLKINKLWRLSNSLKYCKATIYELFPNDGFGYVYDLTGTHPEYTIYTYANPISTADGNKQKKQKQMVHLPHSSAIRTVQFQPDIWQKRYDQAIDYYVKKIQKNAKN